MSTLEERVVTDEFDQSTHVLIVTAEMMHPARQAYVEEEHEVSLSRKLLLCRHGMFIRHLRSWLLVARLQANTDGKSGS